MYSIQHCVIQFVNDLRQVGGMVVGFTTTCVISAYHH